MEVKKIVCMSNLLFKNPTAFEAGLEKAFDGAGSSVRSDAWARFAALGAPHRRMEAWRWTDLRVALRDELVFSSNDDVTGVDAFTAIDPFIITVSSDRAAWNGDAPKGLSLSHVQGGPLHDLLKGHPTGLAAAAFTKAGLALHVEADYDHSRPVLVRYVLNEGQRHVRLFPHVKAGARFTLIESFEGSGASYLNASLEARVDESGAFTRYILQDGADESVQSSVAAVSLAADARFDQAALLLGGKAVRMETRLSCDGANIEASLKSAALIGGARHGDVTSHIVHNAPGCVTRQIHKGVAAAEGRTVFQGKFYVARAAQQTDADMQANALLLSDRAEANHKPELEIYADDVACAHGSTAGSLDDDALFYMRQRGLSDTQARALLIEAFVAEVFDDIASDRLKEIFAGHLNNWLSEHGGIAAAGEGR